MSLQDAIYKMSGTPAQRVNLQDRGLLCTGMKADLVVFDAQECLTGQPLPSHISIRAGSRDVVVNGKVVMREGQVTAARPGRVIYGPAYVH